MGNLFARGLGKALLGAAIIATAFAVTPASAETVLKRGFGASPDTLDPHMNYGAREGWIQDDMYEGLIAGDAKGEMGEGAAKKWEVSDDGLTWTFHLRDGLKWSNGDPLVAQDFVNGVIRQLDPKTASPRAYYFSSLVPLVGGQEFIDAADKGDPKTVGISAPDDKTIVMKLKAPQPNMLYLTESYHIPPLHKPSFDKFGENFIKPENIVNNGAYMMTENVPQSHVTLVKNPNYWNAANVKIDKVIYVVTEDDQTELKRYKADELDVTNEIPSDQLEAVKAEFGDQVRITPYLNAEYISFNITKAPFDNIKVRQALAIGIDRKVLQDKILKAGYQANCGYTPINDPRYPQPQVPECDMSAAERSEKGKALLAEAGFGPDNPLKVTIEIDDRQHRQEDGGRRRVDVEAVPRRRCQGECPGVPGLDGQFLCRRLGCAERQSGRRDAWTRVPPRLHAAERRIRLQLEERRVRGAHGQGGSAEQRRKSATRSWPRPRRCCWTITW